MERRPQLPDEVAADAAIEELADAGDGGGGGEERVDGLVAEFVFQERELVGRGELWDQVED